MNQETFDWVPFYEEFAQKLLKYKNDRKSLLEKLERVKGISTTMVEIHKNVKDIDPFTVMGVIHKKGWPDSNNKNSIAQRKNILQEIQKEFNISAPLPTVNIGIPDLGEAYCHYYNTKADRKEQQKNIQLIWNLFEKILKYANNANEQLQAQIIVDMQQVIDIKFNKIPKVTMAIYWSSPETFLSLDGTNFDYITKNENSSKVFSNEIIDLTKEIFKITETYPKGNVEHYFDLLKLIKEKFKTSEFHSFKELSHIAYETLHSEEVKITSGTSDNESIKNSEVGKNIIVYGVPGSGKSFYIEKQLRDQFKENDKEYRECVERVIFYPEYSYYDFVGQKVPSAEGGLSPEPGNFTKILEKALKNKNKHYYLVIEELNRGNAEAIFGDVFQLLDRNPSGESTYSIDNNFLKEYLTSKGVELTENEIRIPSNLTIYATINNADQNVFNFDTAFGRRWDYQMMPCDPKNENKDTSDGKIFETGTIKGTNIKWDKLRKAINKKILENKNEIYNAEEKRLGLYYINSEWLTGNDNENNDEVVKAFAAKLFRYLYLNVFKNNTELMFKNIGQNILEDYIEYFVNAEKKNEDTIRNLLNVELESKKNENN